MIETHHRVCNLCEAACGLVIEHEGGAIRSIRGDAQDPLSRGHICPKAVALQDLHTDPDRIRRPLRRHGGEWDEIGWDEALDEAGRLIAGVHERHGADGVGVYVGNPTAHDYGAVLAILPLVQSMGTKNFYTANSVDGLPRILTSALLYGNQAILPIPDVERTDFMLVMGANPAVSNGSIMTAPGIVGRLRRLRERGGKLVVVDPRRTETAKLADVHHFLRPGTDALLLAAMLDTLLSEGRTHPRELADHVDGLERLPHLLAPFAPERVAPAVGMPAAEIRNLARDFAAAPSAVCYARVGTCLQEFGTLATWLVDVLNIATGNLDRPGGPMFTTPAIDLPLLARLTGQAGKQGPGRWRSRVSGLPEFNNELPVVVLAEEMDTPGKGQIRALLTHAGNPVLSTPNGRRLEAALAKLEAMVSIDIYINETTRHAHLILPPVSPLEHDHYPVLFHALAVHNTAHYSKPLFAPPPGARDSWEILTDLQAAIGRHRGGLRGRVGQLAGSFLKRLGSRRLLDIFLRMGPHHLTLKKLERHEHGIDLGPLEPRLPGLLKTPGQLLRLVPEVMVTDLQRLHRRMETPAATGDGQLSLIGRRELRSNNSWMHNSARLVRGKDRCTLLMHPADAAARQLATGDRAKVKSRVGELEVPVEVTDDIMPGVVSLPHGWGHARPGVRMRVASQRGGASANDLTDERSFDPVSGTASLNGVPVVVERVAAAAD